MTPVLIVTGQLMLPDEAGGERRVRLAPGWVRLDGGAIAEVNEGDIHPEADVGDAGFLITPGFVDPHLHLPQIDAFGAHGMRLLDWLERVIFPIESRWADADHAQRRMQNCLAQLFSAGTTGIVAYASIHVEATRRALRACERIGMRAAIGAALVDLHPHPELRRPTGQLLDETRRLLDEFPPDRGSRRVEAAVAPRFALACTMELMEGCAVLAEERGAYVQTHLAEMEPEWEQAVALHGGPNYADIYRRAGLMGPRSLLGHCIHLTPSEQKIIAESGSVAVHCPTANVFLRSGTMNRRRWLETGMTVAVASDIGAGYEKSIVRVARSMVEAAFYVDAPPPPIEEVWWQITAGNADALGWSRAGRIAPGHDADLVAIHPDRDWINSYHPLGDLLFSWDDRWIARTIVAGKTVWARP